MRRRLLPVDQEEPQINLTPLIDVVFVILIMFIVVAPLLEIEKIELADASSASQNLASVKESSPISIHVRKDNTIWFNGERVNSEQLLFQLQQAKQRFPKKTPQLFQDREAQFGLYQAVKNAAETAGFYELDIVLKPS